MYFINNLQGSSKVLSGHESRVRGIVWHCEIPWMLITGSWDCMIKTWDVRNETCLFTATDHHSDVYGITMNPEAPFILASYSRDNTIRLWYLPDIRDAILVFN